MEQYRILIPSFKRSEQQSTLQLLSGVYERERIILSTQTKEDYDAYNRLYGGVATVIYREANSVGGNRNTLLEYCEKNNISNGLFLDDDLRGIVFYSGRKTNDAKEIKSVFDYFFEVANKNKAAVFGTYPCDNSFMMDKRIVVNKILIGTILGVTDTRLRFNEEFRIKEDYELCLRLISQGRNTLRFNSVGAIASHKTKGGCCEDWQNKKNKEYGIRLANLYPDLVKLNTKRAGEILMINK